jgi:hypothetical protein
MCRFERGAHCGAFSSVWRGIKKVWLQKTTSKVVPPPLKLLGALQIFSKSNLIYMSLDFF